MLGDFVFTLYKLLFCKNKNKIVSEKTWFIYEEKSGASKIKSGAENVTSMIYEFFILELYFGTFNFDIGFVLLLWR